MGKKKPLYYRILTVALLLLLFICQIVFGGSSSAVTYAAENNSEVEFDNTRVEDDLADISLTDFPVVTDGKPVLFSLQEYCYTDSTFTNGNYGVYLYVYNPSLRRFSEREGANYVNMATAFDEEGIPTDYDNVPLKYLAKTTGEHEGLFYKFKIADSRALWEQVKEYSSAHNGERRYYVAGIQLYASGAANAEEYNVSKSYTYTGHAEGYGSDVNTLECTEQELSSVQIDLAGATDGVDKRVYWRADNANENGRYHQWQINSVYFAVDNDILDEFGHKLKEIKARWYEYQLKPVVVVNDDELYDVMYDYLGVEVGGVNYDSTNNVWASGVNEDIPFDIFVYDDWVFDGSKSEVLLDYAYNIYSEGYNSFKDEQNFDHKNLIDYAENILTSIFYTGGIDVDDYTLSAEELAEWCYNYDKSYVNGMIETGTDRKLSADLFTDSIDEGRTRGENLYTFDVDNPDDYLNLNDYASTQGAFFTWLEEFFGGWKLSGTYEDISPIERVDADISRMADEAVAEYYFIDESFVPQFKEYYNSVKDDSTIFILRYAATDYYAQDCTIRYPTDDRMLTRPVDDYPVNGEIRQETVFLDFEVLTLGFENEEGVMTVIPAVCSPVDHFTAMTPSLEPEFSDWWKILLGILALILILVIFAPILPLVIQFILWLVCLPFKAIAAVFRGIRKSFSKRE